MNTYIVFNTFVLDPTKEHELLPSEGKLFNVELVGFWANGEPLHQVCNCASEVHINYQLGYEFKDTSKVAIKCDLLSTGSTYELSRLTAIRINTVDAPYFKDVE